MKKCLMFVFFLSLGVPALVWAEGETCDDNREEWCQFKCYALEVIKGYCLDLMNAWTEEKCAGNIRETVCEGAPAPAAGLNEHEKQLLQQFQIESDANLLKASPARQNVFAALDGLRQAAVAAGANLTRGDNLWAYFNAISEPIAGLATELGAHSLWQVFESGADRSVLSVYPQLAHACLEDKAAKALLRSNSERVKRAFMEELEGAVKEGFLDPEQSVFIKNLCFLSSDDKTTEKSRKIDERTIKFPYLYWKLARQLQQDSVVTVAALEQMGAVCDKGMILKPLILLNGLLMRNVEKVKAVLETINRRGPK